MTAPNPKVRGPFECQVGRLIRTRPERLFAAWTDPEQARGWLASGGKTILQPHVDGLFFLDMVYQGHSYPHYGRYLAVEANRRLEFTWMSQGTEGKESIVLVLLAPQAEGTMLTITHRGLPDQKNADEHAGGWTEFLGILERTFPE